MRILKMNSLPLIVVVFLLSGCAGISARMYEGPELAGSEIVVVKTGNPQVGVSIVDGKITNSVMYIVAQKWPNRVEMMPGNHIIVPSFIDQYRHVETTGAPVVFYGEKGHTYNLSFYGGDTRLTDLADNKRITPRVVHEQTKLEFPNKLGVLTLSMFKIINEDANEIRVLYSSKSVTKAIFITAYLHKIKSDAESDSDLLDSEVEESIIKASNDDGVTFLSKESIQIEKNDKIVDGRLVKFASEEMKLGEQYYSDLKSRLYFFRYNDEWLISFFVIFPEYRKDEGDKEAIEFIDALVWPEQ